MAAKGLEPISPRLKLSVLPYRPHCPSSNAHPGIKLIYRPHQSAWQENPGGQRWPAKFITDRLTTFYAFHLSIVVFADRNLRVGKTWIFLACQNWASFIIYVHSLICCIYLWVRSWRWLWFFTLFSCTLLRTYLRQANTFLVRVIVLFTWILMTFT